jgi:hypothetical protein
MAKRIRVRGIPRAQPDVRLYVLALIELARQVQAEDQATQRGGQAAPEAPSTGSAEIAHD